MNHRQRLMATAALVLAITSGLLAGEAMTVLAPGALPAGDAETVLASGAVAHVRLHSLDRLIDSVNDLVVPFVPEKALPPDAQAILTQPSPLRAFLGMNTTGQPITAEVLSMMLGLDSKRPVTLSFYPMPPEKGFVLSLPVTDYQVLTGLVMGAFRPRAFTKTEIAGKPGFTIEGMNPDLPRRVTVLCSPDRVYLCGSPDVAGMLLQAPQHLVESPLVRQVLEQYQEQELLLAIDPSFGKPMLQQVAAQYKTLPPPLVRQARRELLRELSPSDRAELDLRLRMNLGLDGLEQALDYAECFATASYEVLCAGLVDELTALEGLALAIDIDKAFQSVSASLFSANIKRSALAAPLPKAAIQAAISQLPGNRDIINVQGRAPAPGQEKALVEWLGRIQAKIAAKGLPSETLPALVRYAGALGTTPTLASRVPWTIQVPHTRSGGGGQVTLVAGSLTKEMQRVSNAMRQAVTSWTHIMPTQEPGFLEAQFRAAAEQENANQAQYAALSKSLGWAEPWLKESNQFHEGPNADGVKTLVLETTYTTTSGLFGYDEHQLINRQYMNYRTCGNLLLVEQARPKQCSLKTLETLPAPKLEKNLETLLAQAPPQAHAMQLTRFLSRTGELVDYLTALEALLHQETADYLKQATALLQKHDQRPAAAQADLAALGMPLTVWSLNRSAETGELYCVLPGDLRYPRGKVMPAVADLLAEFIGKADTVGGGAVFLQGGDGHLQVKLTQSTEALALLVKSTVNRFFETYMLAPDGQARLMQILTVPHDGEPAEPEALLVNPVYEGMQEM